VFHTHCVRWGCGCGGLALAVLAHQVFHLLLSDIFSSLFYDLISICIVHSYSLPPFFVFRFDFGNTTVHVKRRHSWTDAGWPPG
jgi:hypothetical protein